MDAELHILKQLTTLNERILVLVKDLAVTSSRYDSVNEMMKDATTKHAVAMERMEQLINKLEVRVQRIEKFSWRLTGAILVVIAVSQWIFDWVGRQ